MRHLNKNMSLNIIEFGNKDGIVSRHLILQHRFNTLIEPLSSEELMSMDFDKLENIHQTWLTIIKYYKGCDISLPGVKKYLEQFKDYISTLPVLYDRMFDKIIPVIENTIENTETHVVEENNTEKNETFEHISLEILNNTHMSIIKTEEVKTEEVKTEEVKSEEVKTEEVKTEEVKTEEVKSEEVKSEEVKTEEVKSEEVKTEEVKTEEIHVKMSLSEIYKDLGSLPFYKNEDDKYQMSIIVKKKRAEFKNAGKQITFEYMMNLIETDDFISKINRNLNKLYSSKVSKYKTISTDLDIKINEDYRQLNSLKFLLNMKHPEDKFPNLENNVALKEKISTLINKARSRISRLNSEGGIISTRENLVQAITDENKGIMSILGNTREYIREALLKQIFILSRTSKLFIDNFLNIILTGGSGFGKTKIASVIAFVFSKMGILLSDEVFLVSPKDLVSKWVGDSALKTTGILMSGLEAVIFIDECYQITEPNTSNSHGRESLTELVNFMDKYTGLGVIICAGYKDKVDKNFIRGNEGIERRFPIKYELIKYSSIDLTNIFLSNIKKIAEIEFNDDMKKYVFSMITYLNRFNVFENQSGDILNLTQIFSQTFYSSVFDTNVKETLIELFDIVEMSFKLYVDSKELSLDIINEQEFDVSQKVEFDF